MKFDMKEGFYTQNVDTETFNQLDREPKKYWYSVLTFLCISFSQNLVC